MASRITARARASGHSRRRRLVSNDTVTPAARACAIAARPASQAVSLIARLMPDRCKTLAAAMACSGSCAVWKRLAADPARR